MATASSAQREPSMEEILASIRRIIEDSDTGRKQPGDAGELRQDLQPAPAAPPAPEVDAFRAELRTEADTRKPVSLAEVQAQLAAEPVIARMETARMETKVRPEAAPPVTPKAPTTLAEVSASIAAEPSSAEPAAAAEINDAIVADWRREIAAVGETTKAAARPDKVEALTFDTAPEVEIAEDELADEPFFEPAASSGGMARQSDAVAARPAILSEHAGRQVAAAFGELSDAFASRSKKTFDEMAEDMLRPLLQDWLDNNLPTLVERLVREEIERVARGAQ
ncbi:PopZ family protein [Mesorhizobium amorphae]|uniref:PopZ family protein n=1 Tax=Mesorhizobium amorphae TaxID=71433 RepID=UPI003ECE4631